MLIVDATLRNRRNYCAFWLQITSMVILLAAAYSWGPLIGTLMYRAAWLRFLLVRLLPQIGTSLAAAALLVACSIGVRRGNFAGITAGAAICVAMLVSLISPWLRTVALRRSPDLLIQSLCTGVYAIGAYFSLRLYLLENQRTASPMEMRAAAAAQLRAKIGLLILGIATIAPAVLLIGFLVYDFAHSQRIMPADRQNIMTILITVLGVIGLGIGLLACGSMLGRGGSGIMFWALILVILDLVAALMLDRWLILGASVVRVPFSSMMVLALPTWVIAELLHASRQIDDTTLSHGFEVRTIPALQRESERFSK